MKHLSRRWKVKRTVELTAKELLQATSKKLPRPEPTGTSALKCQCSTPHPSFLKAVKIERTDFKCSILITIPFQRRQNKEKGSSLSISINFITSHTLRLSPMTGSWSWPRGKGWERTGRGKREEKFANPSDLIMQFIGNMNRMFWRNSHFPQAILQSFLIFHFIFSDLSRNGEDDKTVQMFRIWQIWSMKSRDRRRCSI